ncbi:arrestin, lateral eye-like [Teleopsis dalmanni]|uniref:arrestin, lateral eye-like n=1 Tax=Teleopsis dalmanni TaxID=139649 RepID=UPI0018CF9744|nr:arrestin, lateral eye-like [Teleopsis dalmanni]
MVLGWDYKSSEFTLPSTKNKRYCPFECIDLLTTSKDEFGTQRVYKKTSPNCVITLYLPTREITLSGSSPSILRGIVFVDPKAIQGYRVYAQLTLTFRYGREDEEVMGLRFCNEAIMSLHQIWPRNEEPARESLSPLQEALVKRLGDGAHPFTLSLTSQAPPSVQLVPAKRYYGAPIGTSYDVRCFIATTLTHLARKQQQQPFRRRNNVKETVRLKSTLHRCFSCFYVI